ncbi:GlxA family transcriptional regulator [Nocardia mexicana]|nr:helix-turn-helix domain-containing protein [Nocardia mexicana]
MDAAVLIVDDVADFGLAALLHTFDTANRLRSKLESAPPPWNIRYVAVGDSARTSNGFTVPTTPVSDLPDDVDLMIVPSVHITEPEPLIELVSSPVSVPILDAIRRAHSHGVHVAAACAATFYLAEAGVLNGSPTTTSWWLGPAFRRRYPAADLDEGRILCRGNRVTTAGAGLAHIDLALSFIHAQSPTLAELVPKYMTVGNRGNQVDFAIPEVVARGDSLTAEFERWVRSHLTDQFQLSRAARHLGVTARSLQRTLQGELGMSPMDFVDEIRLERATHLLGTTSLTVDAVATQVGYLSAAALRGLIRRRRGMSIAQIRTTHRTVCRPGSVRSGDEPAVSTARQGR